MSTIGTGAIGIATGHPSGIKNGIKLMKEYLRSVVRDVLHLYDTVWRGDGGPTQAMYAS